MTEKKRIIFSLGFDTSGVISLLTELNLNPGDEIIFLVPKHDTPKSIEARENLDRFLRLLSQRGLELHYEFHRLNEEDAASMIAEIVNLVEEGEKVYLEALGGLRSIVAAMAVAAVLCQDKVAELAAVAESTSRRVKIPLPPVKPIRLDELDTEIIRLALESRNGLITLPYLQQTMEKPKSTLSDKLRRLEEMGLLRRVRSRPATFKPTPLAKALLRVGKHG